MKKLILFLCVLPNIACAQVPGNVFELMTLILSWFNRLIPFLIGVTLLIIFWNLTQFVLHAGEEREREKYKQFMIWGVVAVFLIISFWGIVYFIAGSFFGNNNPMLINPGYADKNGNPL
jgi:uncharacterized membrane protein YidH (DUF202 family)